MDRVGKFGKSGFVGAQITILLHKDILFVCVCVCTVCVCACDDDVSAASAKDTSTAEVYVKSLCITLL